MTHWQDASCDLVYLVHGLTKCLRDTTQVIEERGLRNTEEIGTQLKLVERTLIADIKLLNNVFNRYWPNRLDLGDSPQVD